MFHSFGTVQSNACVPVGTSEICNGRILPIRSSVSRKPAPVMLRQSGNRSAMSSYIEAPASADGT